MVWRLYEVKTVMVNSGRVNQAQKLEKDCGQFNKWREKNIYDLVRNGFKLIWGEHCGDDPSTFLKTFLFNIPYNLEFQSYPWNIFCINLKFAQNVISFKSLYLCYLYLISILLLWRWFYINVHILRVFGSFVRWGHKSSLYRMARFVEHSDKNNRMWVRGTSWWWIFF